MHENAVVLTNSPALQARHDLRSGELNLPMSHNWHRKEPWLVATLPGSHSSQLFGNGGIVTLLNFPCSHETQDCPLSFTYFPRGLCATQTGAKRTASS